MKNILNVSKISLKPIFMSLAILFTTGVSFPNSFEKVVGASYSDDFIKEKGPNDKYNSEEEEEEEADDKDDSNLGFKSDDFPSANDPISVPKEEEEASGSGSNCFNIKALPGVIQLDKDQVEQLFRKPFGTVVCTEEQAKKLFNDGIFTKKDVEKERRLRNRIQLESNEKSALNPNPSSKAKHFLFCKRQRNVE